MAKTYLTSYATERFYPVQSDLNRSAIDHGISNILSFHEADLKESAYYESNRSILDEVCGAGYWAWKPHFVLKALEHLQEGDVLFYCDAGSMFVDSPEPLVKLCASHPQGIVLFDAQPLTNRQFTKRDCFVRLGCDLPEYWDAKKVIATIFVIRKTAASVTFIQEWLRHCQDRAAITDDPNICGFEDLPDYIQHRWDQAILSVLAAKHHLETFRNPTFWGNFLKTPEFRIPGEQVVSPYGIPPRIDSYAEIPQTNSPYGTIFLINRLPNYVGKNIGALPSLSYRKSKFRRAISFISKLR